MPVKSVHDRPRTAPEKRSLSTGVCGQSERPRDAWTGAWTVPLGACDIPVIPGFVLSMDAVDGRRGQAATGPQSGTVHAVHTPLEGVWTWTGREPDLEDVDDKARAGDPLDRVGSALTTSGGEHA